MCVLSENQNSVEINKIALVIFKLYGALVHEMQVMDFDSFSPCQDAKIGYIITFNLQLK